MNTANLMGRLTRDPEVRQTGDLVVARFTLAINRPKVEGKEEQADFISCVAFGKRASAIGNYVRKGDQLGVTGRIQTGSYERQDGTKVYTTDVIVDRMDFVGSKKDRQSPAPGQQEYRDDPAPYPGVPEGFHEIDDFDDDDIPF